MPKLLVLLMVLILQPACSCQEKVKIDADSPTKKTEQRVVSGTGKGGLGESPETIWKVDLSASATATDGFIVMETHVINSSEVSRLLPLSQDRIKVVAECPQHTVLEAVLSISGKDALSAPSRLEVFSGCAAFKDTVVWLKPGEWVSYTMKVVQARLPQEVMAQVDIVNTKYRLGSKGMTAEGLEIPAVAVSPLLQVPEPSHASN